MMGPMVMASRAGEDGFHGRCARGVGGWAEVAVAVAVSAVS